MTKPLLIIIAVMAAVIGAESLWIKSLYADKAELKVERDAAKSSLLALEKQNKTTEENAHDQKVETDNIRRQLARFKRLSGECKRVPLTTTPAVGNRSTGSGIVSGEGSVFTGDILDLGADAEEVRKALIYCQSFTNGLYKANGY